MIGSTFSVGFPALPGAFDIDFNGNRDALDFPTTALAYTATYPGNGDVFVVKLNAVGSERVYATYLGGPAGIDIGRDIVVTGDGAAYITGHTTAADFPTSSGDSVVVDESGAAYITRNTHSENFPITPNAYDTSYNGADDVFVAKLRMRPTYTISGRIRDSQNLPISGMTISDRAGHTAISGDDGAYILTGLAPGAYTIEPIGKRYIITP